MKTIIVATDYSATANNALQYAASLAREFHAELILFNVYHLNVHVRNSLASPETIDTILKDNKTRLTRLADETSQSFGIKVTYEIKTADTVEELDHYVAEHKPDLVVMGMDSNLKEYKLMGNTTTAVIKSKKYPVLVVPNDVSFRQLKKVLYACEYKYVSEDNHLDLLTEMVRQFNAELQVLHVETHAETAVPVEVDTQVAAMDKIVGQVDHTYRFLASPDVTEGILEGAASWHADLLVMVPHKAGIWESLFKGSKTREVALRTRVPLLVLPNAD